MFDFDEKYLYPMGAPRHPHDGCGHPPPHEGDGCFPPDRPAFTLTEDMKHTIAQMNETIRHLVAFEKRIQSKYEETMKVLTSDNVLFKNTFANAHTLFVQEVKNEVNEFEGNIDASFEVFKTAIETDYKALLEKCETLIADAEDSLKKAVDAHNAKNAATFNGYVVSLNARLNEVERELRNAYSDFTLSTDEALEAWKNTIESRLGDELTAEVERIIADVAFDEVIGESVTAFKRDLNYVTPEQFGAVGDGSKDDSAAIASAIDYASTHNIRRVVFRGMYRVDTPITLSNYRQDKTHKPVSLECSDGMQYTNCIIGNTGREVFKLENTHHMVCKLNIVSSEYVHDMFVNPVPANERNGSTIGIIVTRGTVEPSTHTAEFGGTIYMHHDMSVNDGYGTVGLYNDTCEMVNYSDCWYVADTPVIITTRDILGITDNPYNASCKDHYFVGRNVLISRGNVCILIDGALGVHGTIYGNGEGDGDSTTCLRVPTYLQNFDLTIDTEQTRHAVDGKGCLSYGRLNLCSAGLVKGITDVSLNAVDVYDNLYFTDNNNVVLEITNGENVMGCNIYTQYASAEKPRKIINNYILANTNVYPANSVTLGTVTIVKGDGSIMTLATVFEGNVDGYARNIDGRMVGWSYAEPTADVRTGSLFINRSDIMEVQDGHPAFWLKRGTEYQGIVQVGYRRVAVTALATTTPRLIGELIVDDNNKLHMGTALTAGAWTD